MAVTNVQPDEDGEIRVSMTYSPFELSSSPPTVFTDLVGRTPRKLTRRERFMDRINFAVRDVREFIALKLAPWLGDWD